MKKICILIFIFILAVNGNTIKKRVCIVGAGTSGLVAAKHFREYPDEFETVVFEKNSDVGGLWIYTNSTTVDEHGLPIASGIYKNLRTNAPKQLMTFTDYVNFGGKGKDGSFIKHEDVLEYLQNYTNHFNLRQYIQFDSYVENVEPLHDHRWLIVTKNLNTKKKNKTLCDAAIICNGHDATRYVPEIPGIESFIGQVLHSQEYRVPEKFTNQTVVVLGASSSGTDIGIEISSTAKIVYLSHRHEKLPGAFPPNLKQVPGVVAAVGNELILSDGSRIQADSLVLCTGYRYSFPFLRENSGVTVDGTKYIRSLYKHLINIEHPTMAVVSVVYPGIHFLIPQAQIRYFRAVLRGNLTLPSREQMLHEARLPANVPKNKAHFMDYDVFYSYYDELSVATGGKMAPWWARPASDLIQLHYLNDPVCYRDKRLIIHEDGYVELV